MTRNARLARRRAAAVATPTATQMEAAIVAKFDRLAALKRQLAGMKTVYEQHDALAQELMGMFITPKPDGGWDVKVSLTFGRRTFRYSPAFFDEKKSQLTPKNWKSGAYSTGTIQS